MIFTCDPFGSREVVWKEDQLSYVSRISYPVWRESVGMSKITETSNSPLNLRMLLPWELKTQKLLGRLCIRYKYYRAVTASVPYKER